MVAPVIEEFSGSIGADLVEEAREDIKAATAE